MPCEELGTQFHAGPDAIASPVKVEDDTGEPQPKKPRTAKSQKAVDNKNIGQVVTIPADQVQGNPMEKVLMASMVGRSKKADKNVFLQLHPNNKRYVVNMGTINQHVAYGTLLAGFGKGTFKGREGI